MNGWLDALPTPRVPDAMQAPALRWGFLGTGWICQRFAESVLANTQQRLVAVGSRSIDQARGFADRYGMARAHGSYEDLVNDANIDVVYVGTPHNFHVEHGLLAIEAGKHVLIEKPIALSSADLERLLSAANDRGVLCQEAFWSFFLPKFDVMRQLLDDGVLGGLVSVIADHGEWLPPEHRIHDPNLAGGSLHDLGVYVFALSAWSVGRPTSVTALGSMTATGVMGDVGIVMRGDSGVVSSLSTTMMATTPCRAVLGGTNATLTTDEGFFFPGGFAVTEHRSGRSLRWDEPNTRHGALSFEAAEVARRIHQGETSTSQWTQGNARDVMSILDRVNTSLGLA